MLRPLGDRILVKRAEVEEKKGSIIIPDAAKEKPQEGWVVAAGRGRVTEEGTFQPMEVKEGDKVLFSKYAGTEVNLGDEPHLVLREDDVLGIVE